MAKKQAPNKKSTSKKSASKKSSSTNSAPGKAVATEKMDPAKLDLEIQQAFIEEWMAAHPNFTELSTQMMMKQSKHWMVCSKVIKRFLEPQTESAE